MLDQNNPTVHTADLPTDNPTHQYTAADFWSVAQSGRVDKMVLIALSKQKPLRDYAIRHLRARYGIFITVDLAAENLDPAAEARLKEQALAYIEPDACTCANCERGPIDAAS